MNRLISFRERRDTEAWLIFHLLYSVNIIQSHKLYTQVGAAIGVAVEALKATDDQSLVLRRCLDSKGYDVYDLRS